AARLRGQGNGAGTRRGRGARTGASGGHGGHHVPGELRGTIGGRKTSDRGKCWQGVPAGGSVCQPRFGTRAGGASLGAYTTARGDRQRGSRLRRDAAQGAYRPPVGRRRGPVPR